MRPSNRIVSRLGSRMNLICGFGGARLRAVNDECVDSRDADMVGVAESAGASDSLGRAQPKARGLRCELNPNVRCPPGVGRG